MLIESSKHLDTIINRFLKHGISAVPVKSKERCFLPVAKPRVLISLIFSSHRKSRSKIQTGCLHEQKKISYFPTPQKTCLKVLKELSFY